MKLQDRIALLIKKNLTPTNSTVLQSPPPPARYDALDQKSQKRTKKRAQKRKIAQKRTQKRKKTYPKKENVTKKVLKKGSLLKKELKKGVLLKKVL